MKHGLLFKVMGLCLAFTLMLGAIYIPTALKTDASIELTLRSCDANKDGLINTKDIVRVLKYIKNPAKYPYSSAVDANDDGIISYADVNMMKTYFGRTYDTASYRRPTYEELVERIIQETRNVTDFCNYNNFSYGDAVVNPAINYPDLNINNYHYKDERLTACNRLVCWVLYRVGYVNQRYYHGQIEEYMYTNYWNFTKITDVNQVRRGDIVFIPGHEFICAGTNLRYDHGSVERIRRIGAFSYVDNSSEPFVEPINSSFMYAMRPNPAGLPDSSIKELYNEVPLEAAEPNPNAVDVVTYANAVGTRTFDFHYNPYAFKQYEFHTSLTSSASNTADYNGAFVGVRLPSATHNPTASGGIWLAFSQTGFARLYTGVGCGNSRVSGVFGGNWKESLISIPLPVSFSVGRRITVVDSGDVIKYYMYPGDGTRFLICSIKLDPNYEHIVIRDCVGKFLYAGITDLNHTGFFKVWANNATVTTLDTVIKQG